MAKKVHPEFYKYAVSILRHGYVSPVTGKRMGKFADGFDAANGYDMRKVSDWTPQQKAAVTRLYKHVNELAARPFHIYRSKNKKKLRAVQEFAQHQEFPKKLKVAFVPVADPAQKPIIKIKGDVVSVKERNVWTSKIPLDPKRLQRNPQKTIEAAIADRPEKSFAIQAGKYEIAGTFPKSQIVGEVKKLMHKYSAERFDKKKNSSSYYGNWLGGLVAYKFDKMKDKDEYDIAKSRNKEQKRLARRRENYKLAELKGRK